MIDYLRALFKIGVWAFGIFCIIWVIEASAQITPALLYLGKVIAVVGVLAFVPEKD